MGRQVKSAVRVITVLEHFAQRPASATVSEIADLLGLPQSSTSMLLGTLVSLGYLQKEKGTRRYYPTLRVSLLGAGPNVGIQTIGQLAEGMEELRRRTGGSVMIGMRQGVHARYIVALRGQNPIHDDFVLGVMRPICRVAPGKVLLAQETDTEIGRIVRRANAEESDPEYRIPLPAFLREIDAIRRQGWAESPGARTMATGLIAIGLPPLAGQPPLSLALGLPIAEAQSRRGEMVAALHAVSDGAFSPRTGSMQVHPGTAPP